MNRTVTVIGLGAMGAALATAFIKAGHPTTVWNRSPSKCEAFASQGARVAGSVPEAVMSGDVVIVCISGYDAVKAVLGEISDLGGRTIVNVSSGTSSGARDMAQLVAQRNGLYLDGAILDVPSEIGPGKSANILYSGNESAYDRHKPILEAMGNGMHYVGADPGLSSLQDVVALGVAWSALNGFFQGVALLEAAGHDPRSAVPMIVGTLETVASWLPGYAEQINDGVYAVTDASIDAHFHAIGNLISESESAGISTELPEMLRNFVGPAVAAGDGGKGYAAIIKQFRSKATT